MREIETITEAHKIILDIAKAFHEVCLRNNITYYMGYGTMLGAIRHKGFIPWDDDMDFLVRREDFDKLRTILARDLPAHYQLLSRKNNIGIYGEILKIEDSRTSIVEQTNLEHANSYGLFIDIFPLDFSMNTSMRPLSRNWIITRLFQCEHNKALKYRIVKAIVGGVDIIKHIVAKHGDYYGEYNGMDCRKTIMPKCIFGNPILYSFEDSSFYGVKDAKAYLTHIYGDYMQLPPEDKRHTHIEYMAYK